MTEREVEFMADLERAVEWESSLVGYAPISPTADAPRDGEGNLVWLWRDFYEWLYLGAWLGEHGIDLPLADDIEADLCRQVADLMDANLVAPDVRDIQEIQLWRSCGGYRYAGMERELPTIH